MVTKAKTKTKGGNSIPKSSLTSAVTSDLPATKGPEGEGDAKVDLTKATIPTSAITMPEAPMAGRELSEADEAELDAVNNDAMTRANDVGLGLVQTEGIDFRYVGVAPARDNKPTTPSGYPITADNSRFTPLAMVPFHPSIRIKDPKSGKFYNAPDGVSSWDAVHLEGEYLIPREADKTMVKARRAAKIEALNRG